MKGYPVYAGFMGLIPHKGYVLFATEDEYCEYYETHKGEWEDINYA